MRRPIFVLVLFALLLTSCTRTRPAPTVATERITDENLIGTIKQDAPCYRGPDPRFGIATKLKNASLISIIGASENGEYAVINDPNNIGKICWVDLSAVDISSDIVAKVFLELATGSSDSSGDDLGSDDLIAEFLKMNTGDSDGSDNSDNGGMVLKFHILVDYHCPSEQKSASSAESDGSDPVGQALHDGCTLGGLICHTSSAADDNSKSECGYMVYPVYYFQKIDCSYSSDCITSTPPPVNFIPCTSTPKPSTPFILNLTLCWNGPGPDYEGISSVEENTPVEVLGVGATGDYIVITNPRYNRPCWVKESDIDLDGLDISGMKIFEVPNQDEPPESPEMGCMYASSPSAAPTCVKPCPDPVAYPITCEP